MAATSLRSKTVVIVGGTSGIGFAVAQAALEEGAKVVVASSKAENVEGAVARLGEGAQGWAVDVNDEAGLAAFFQRLGGFDHLVYTAGDWTGFRGGPLRDLDLTAANAAFTVRFWGALAAIKHGLGKIAEGGSITLTDGMMAHRPMKGAALSTAMLGAIEHLTRGLAVDLAPVRVNAVCPGLVLTDRTRGMPEEMIQRYTAAQPLARGAEPAEVAQAYLYLMRAGYTTGQVLKVDGGRSVV
jgi:NAD(P)-dependent dehydrogenase (short-subunit alcohol dehydrogenase family)